MNALEQQAFLEIFMALGQGGDDLYSLLRGSLSAMLRKLNCNMGAVACTREDGGVEIVYSVPRHIGRSPQILSICRQGAAEFAVSAQPLLVTPPGQAFMAFPLPGYGILMLGKAGDAFSRPVMGMMVKTAHKLAAACVASERTQAIKDSDLQKRMRIVELETIYRFGKAADEARSLDQVYAAAMDAILFATEADRVSILRFDPHGVMRFVAWHRLSDDYRAAAEGHSPWTPDAIDPHSVLVDDIERDAGMEHFRPVAAREGIRALAFIPLVKRGRPIGKFMIYFDRPHNFTEYEVRLAQSIAAHVASAIESKQAELETRIAAITFEAQEGMIVTDANAVILKVNHSFTMITGYSAEEVVGRTPAILSSGRQDADFYRDMWERLRRDGVWRGEIWNRRKNGDIFPEWLSITAVTDREGVTTNYVGTFFDISARKQAEEEIHRLAFFDPLTTLPNRRLLHDRLRQALTDSQRSDRRGAVMFIDLDHFKTLNDTKGHDVGDLLLKAVAWRLHECLREGDTVARLGGDEFVVVLENLSDNADEAAAQADLVAEKLRQTIALPCQLGAYEYHTTLSIGVTLFHGTGATPDLLLKKADTALYQAKFSGRNSVRFFDPDMQTAVEARAEISIDLRRAMKNQQFCLHYQVQIGAGGQPIGVEALLRWDDPGRGLVSPAQFIPVAEDTGMIVPIGAWVLTTACTQIRDWAVDPVTRGLQVAVNVSARQFRQPDFVKQVHQVISETRIDPKRLKLELTESFVLDNVKDSANKMNALKEMGVYISIDDFGTGYSSLSYLKHFPLDQLKIDQSFVRDLVFDPNDAAIVQAIISMGRAFGVEVIAEGVETEEQRQVLETLGCKSFQGYLYGRPLPPGDLQQLVSRYGNHGTDILQ